MTLLETKSGAQWKRIGVKHHHGLAIPLFSLHSKTSSGIGEFFDLVPLVDFCKEVGMDVIQLLPLNDTGQETSPYNALSAFALNPLHISLHLLPDVDKVPQWKEKLQDLHQLCDSLKVNYPELHLKKTTFLEEYAKVAFPIISQTSEYKKFKKENSWLPSYCLFKVLKELQGWSSWETWPGRLRSPSDRQMEELLYEHEVAMEPHALLQFVAFSQLSEVKRIANEKGVFLKGDIPILLSRDSADVWAYRHYFHLHLTAGSPPDMYSSVGQTWGFPVYDWHELAKHNYDWWKNRLDVSSRLYNLYRLDHVVGFFRLWTVPLGKKALEGAFLPANEKEWIPSGKKIMELLLEHSPMLPIAEDLGTVPPSVRACLTELGIPGTKVMRWERKWEKDGSFIDPKEYNPISMTTVSTHDSDTLQHWWRHSPKEAKLFCEFKHWEYRPFLTLEQNKELLWDSHHSASLFHINLLMEYLALFPDLISSNPQDERVNIPGKTVSSNWAYRFRPSVEQLIENQALKETIRGLLPRVTG